MTDSEVIIAQSESGGFEKNALRSPEFAKNAIEEQIEEEKKRLKVLDPARPCLFYDKSRIPEGVLSRLISNIEEDRMQELIEEIRQRTVRDLRSETDIYVNAQKLGDEFDPYATHIRDMKLGHGVRIKVEHRDSGTSARLGLDVSDTAGLYLPTSNEIYVITEDLEAGFSGILLGMVTVEEVQSDHITTAHEVTHSGIAGSKEPESETAKISRQFVGIKELLSDIFVQKGNREFRDKYEESTGSTYAIFTEVIARIAQADFGFQEMMPVETVLDSLKSNGYQGSVANYEQHNGKFDIDNFIKNVYLFASALTAFGYTGVDIERYMCEQFVPNSEENYGPEWFLKKMEDWLEKSKADHALVMSTAFDLQEVAIQKSRLRFLRTERILLENAFAVLSENPMENNNGRVLDFSDEENVRLRLIDATLEGVSNSIDVVARSSGEPDSDPVIRVEMRGVDGNLKLKMDEQVFFSQYSEDELKSLAERIWGHMNEEAREVFVEVLKKVDRGSLVAFSDFDKTNGRLLEAVVEIAIKEPGGEMWVDFVKGVMSVSRARSRREYLLTLENGSASVEIMQIPKIVQSEVREKFNERLKEVLVDNPEMLVILGDVSGDFFNNPFDLYKNMSEKREGMLGVAKEFNRGGAMDLFGAVTVLNSLLTAGKMVETSHVGVERAVAMLEFVKICNKEYYSLLK